MEDKGDGEIYNDWVELKAKNIVWILAHLKEEQM